MTFEEFLKKLDKDINPDKAYKLYMQTKILILEELFIASNLVGREALDRIEQKVFNAIVVNNQKK